MECENSRAEQPSRRPLPDRWIVVRDQRTVAVLAILYLLTVLGVTLGRRRSGELVPVDTLPDSPLLLLVDVNRADASELSLLPGIGPALAERVIQRRQIQPFRYVEELREVVGIGPKTLDRLRPLVLCGRPPTAP